MSRVLFITYDGLLDPLGGSQILPYIYLIREVADSVHVVSFEKDGRFKQGAGALREKLDNAGINWTPVSFTIGHGKLGKAWDLMRMYWVCLRLSAQKGFSFVHCRSYQAAQVGCLLRTLTRAKMIFDMRGLWADERLDGGLWSRDKLSDRLAYAIYKWIERRLLLCADSIVVLTERVKPELPRIAPGLNAPITVIPCCADFAHFSLDLLGDTSTTRQRLCIPPEAFVLTYLGSLGTWYLLDEMLELFRAAANKREDVHLMMITQDWRDEHEVRLAALGMDTLRAKIHVVSASRTEIPSLLREADVMLSFISPSYSKIASSPTKLAESFAMGLPVISNSGVGDVDQITRDIDGGIIIHLDKDKDFDAVVERLDEIRQMGGRNLRERARKHFDIPVAREKYHKIYEELKSRSFEAR